MNPNYRGHSCSGSVQLASNIVEPCRRSSVLFCWERNRTMLRKLLASLALAAAISVPLASSANAGIGDGAALGAPSLVTQPPDVEEAQFIYGGYNYCWYPA